MNGTSSALPPYTRAIMEYPVVLEGRARTFVARMPVEALVDVSDGSDISVFLYCWASPERGQGARAHYKPCDIAASTGQQAPDPTHNGEFRLTVNIRDDDPDLLKITACMRMKDPQTNNTRNAVLASSAVQLDRLLMGEEQSLTMYDQFTPGNYTEVVIRASNADDYANCARAARALAGRNDLDSGPRIRLSRSHLWDLDVFDKEVTAVSSKIGDSILKNGVQYTPGGAQFNTGLTRSARVVLFISLFLGTPAYALTPYLAAGSSGGPSSSRIQQVSAVPVAGVYLKRRLRPLPSPCSAPTTPS